MHDLTCPVKFYWLWMLTGVDLTLHSGDELRVWSQGESLGARGLK
jgi:hypothetical protein